MVSVKSLCEIIKQAGWNKQGHLFFNASPIVLCLDHMRVIWDCGGKLWGGLKYFRESFDCCHSGKDTTIRLSSEVTCRSGGKAAFDTLQTCE